MYGLDLRYNGTKHDIQSTSNTSNGCVDMALMQVGIKYQIATVPLK
jgi:hypothetical protein